MTLHPTDDINQNIRQLIRSGKLDEASELCISTVQSGHVNKETYIFFILFLIRLKELEAHLPQIFDISRDPDVLISHYHALKFFIRRQEFPQMEPLQQELYSYCRETNPSAAALETIIQYSTLDPEMVMEKIMQGMTDNLFAMAKNRNAFEFASENLKDILSADTPEKSICFIICYNDELFLSECIAYIRTLHVPDGFSVDIFSVGDAPSMTSGYQYAMTHSDAKYKVYLHQDVFIINPDFLIRMLDIFQTDSQIGMLGLVGTPQLPESGIMWDNDCRCGTCRTNLIIEESISYFPHPIPGSYQEVEAVDGLLLATQYDLPWREDLFTGWDFYDVSQSEEFRLAGYKIVVPRQDTPWVLHDDDITTTTNYNVWQNIFLKEYR